MSTIMATPVQLVVILVIDPIKQQLLVITYCNKCRQHIHDEFNENNTSIRIYICSVLE